jgi:hypothetical protein
MGRIDLAIPLMKLVGIREQQALLARMEIQSLQYVGRNAMSCGGLPSDGVDPAHMAQGLLLCRQVLKIAQQPSDSKGVGGVPVLKRR